MTTGEAAPLYRLTHTHTHPNARTDNPTNHISEQQGEDSDDAHTNPHTQTHTQTDTLINNSKGSRQSSASDVIAACGVNRLLFGIIAFGALMCRIGRSMDVAKYVFMDVRVCVCVGLAVLKHGTTYRFVSVYECVCVCVRLCVRTAKCNMLIYESETYPTVCRATGCGVAAVGYSLGGGGGSRAV